MSTINRENIGKHLLETQLAIVGKDLMAMVDNDMWRFDYTLTLKQYTDFKIESEKIIKKVYKCNSTKTALIFDQFYILFGLRIKN